MQDAANRWDQRTEKRAATKVTVAALGSGAADSAARQERYRQRETKLLEASALQKRGELPLFIERKIGPTLDMLSAAPSEAARKAGRPVARIVTSVDPHVQPEGEATGFLVAPSLLLTNWHVFPDKGEARGTGANFLYERDEKGLEVGITFEIDPDAFYLSNQTLDYCFVAINPRAIDRSASDNLGTIALIEATPKILIGQKVNIIEHPEGREKQYAYKNNRLLDILDQGFLHYETDTLEGSWGPRLSAKCGNSWGCIMPVFQKCRTAALSRKAAACGIPTWARTKSIGSPMKESASAQSCSLSRQ